MTHALTRRQATESDIDFLLRLRMETMDAYLIASGVALTQSDHMARVLHRYDCAEVLLEHGQPVGLLKLARETGEWGIMQLQLAPRVQGQGLGKVAVEEVIAEARGAGVALVLSVLKVNPARRLYERLGFEVVGEDELEYHMRLRADSRPVPARPDRR